MREICIKTTTSDNHKRKNLCITEIIDQDGYTARAEKKYAYYVSEQNRNIFKDQKELKDWMDLQSQALHKKTRHVSIKKIFDRKSGIGQMVYRVIGSFYVVQDLHVFAVVFMHTIKFDMFSQEPPSLTETV